MRKPQMTYNQKNHNCTHQQPQSWHWKMMT